MASNQAAGVSNILVATDFSSASVVALHRAARLAEAVGSALTVAHVQTDLRRAIAEIPIEAREKELAADPSQFGGAIRAHSSQRLEQLVAPLRERLPALRHVSLLGVPYVALIHLVQAEGFDLLVVGSTGTGAIKRFVIGSTAERLVRACPCPVWVIRGEGEDLPGTILVPVDFTAVCGKALEQAAWLAQRSSRRLVVLHVFPDPKDLVEEEPGETPGAAILRTYREASRSLRRELNRFVKAHVPPEVEVDVKLKQGVPWKSIGAFATRIKADLVVMASVARTGIRGFVIGNTAEKFLRTSTTSLWTIKPNSFVSPIAPAFWELYPSAPQGRPRTGAAESAPPLPE